VVRLCRHLKGAPVARHLGSQLLRSGTSIGANLEEAHAGQSKRDFISKASIALKEARETLYWLRLLEASGLVPAGRHAPLRAEADEMVAILTTILRNARRSTPRDPPRTLTRAVLFLHSSFYVLHSLCPGART
jgi:four helix bundle protein